MAEQILEIINCPNCNGNVQKFVRGIYSGDIRICLKCGWMGYAMAFVGIIKDSKVYPTHGISGNYREVTKA